jgi:AcrR family transcriptional regulator
LTPGDGRRRKGACVSSKEASAKEASAAPPRRLRGRPAKLSSAAILQTAQDLLTEVSPEQLTVGLVAERLGAPVTSVGNYFPNRFSLIAALADSLFPLFVFQPPPPSTPWTEALMSWLQSVDRFFQAHPVALKVIGADDRTSPAWAHVQAPLIGLLRQAGLHGRELAGAALAVHTQLIGLLFMANFSLRPQVDDAAPPSPETDPEQQALAEIRAWRATLRRDDIVGFGLRAIVAELARTAGVQQPADGRQADF